MHMIDISINLTNFNILSIYFSQIDKTELQDHEVKKVTIHRQFTIYFSSLNVDTNKQCTKNNC